MPSIHVFLARSEDVDGRDKPGHDASHNGAARLQNLNLNCGQALWPMWRIGRPALTNE
jgi:hypothetical protein